MKSEFTSLATWKRTLVGAALATTLLMGGCQVPIQPAAVTDAAAAVITIKAREYAFEAPQEISGGWVRIALENEGEAMHHVQLIRLNDGVSLEQFQTGLQGGPMALFDLATMAGGSAPLDPGSRQEVSMYLDPGQYVLLSLVPDAQGVPYLAHGMVTPLVVTDVTDAAEPVADGEVKFLDFAFVLPTAIKAGEQTWKIVDEGEQAHEMQLIKLAEGKTMDDVQHWMHQPTGEAPFANVGGIQGIDPGETAYLHLDLTPGHYVAICHIPDSETMKEHAELGMVLPFIVE